MERYILNIVVRIDYKVKDHIIGGDNTKDAAICVGAN